MLCGSRGQSRRDLQRIRHVWIVITHVRQAARLAGIETPARTRGGPEIQGREGVDLSSMRDRRDRAEDALRLTPDEGREIVRIGDQPTAPAGVGVYNPAFDVTPAALITAIITDRGVLRAPYEEAIRALFPG